MEGFGDQKVAGNQTAVKEHGKVDKQRQRRTAAEALQAQGICYHTGDKHG